MLIIKKCSPVLCYVMSFWFKYSVLHFILKCLWNETHSDMFCLQPVTSHSMYNLKLQASLKRIQDNLILPDPSQYTESDSDQTERTKDKVCACTSVFAVPCAHVTVHDSLTGKI
jgi:hypothetical protein